MTPEIIVILIAVGAFVGFVAGLFGIGGGMIMVPVLMVLFDHWQIPVATSGVMAVATSVGCIVFTGMSSALSHIRQGNVDWAVFPLLAVGVAVGGVLGSTLGDYVGGVAVLQVFSAFAYYSAYRLFTARPNTEVDTPPAPKPAPIMVGMGAVIGAVSNMVGIGGGVLSVPVLVMLGTVMRIAIGTSAVLGVCLAIPGAVRYATMTPPDLVQGAVGYIHVPALLALVAGSVFMAPVGAKMATHMNANRLKRYWAMLIIVAGTAILYRSLLP